MFGLIRKKDILTLIDEEIDFYRTMYKLSQDDRNDLLERKEIYSEKTFDKYFKKHDEEMREYLIQGEVLTKIRTKISKF